MSLIADASAPQGPSTAAIDPATPDVPAAVREAVHETCRAARAAARTLATTTGSRRDAALLGIADALASHTDRIVAANRADLERGREGGLSQALLDRLRLDESRVRAVAAAVRDVVALPDPLGEVVRGATTATGLRVSQVRRPLGVVGMVYEARPNVTVDAAALCLKSGNAVVLRGGSAAAATNEALVGVLREALTAAGLPADAVATIDSQGRAGVRALLRARGLVDVVVPRGGADLIATVVQTATVPTVETGTGNCHVYVDAAADLDQALAICLNAKTQRPSVCNAAETVLVHAAVADRFLARLLPAMREAGVTLHGDAVTVTAGEAVGVPVVPATEADWDTEYLALELAVRVVPGLDEALAHIARHSSGHTEAVCTQDIRVAERFVAEVDAAGVAVNASTRFIDGGELGLGAEIGIATQKLHARGPMGVRELTTTTWVVVGDGHVRG